MNRILISKEKIDQRVRELAQEIHETLKGRVSHEEPLVVIGILKGSFIFLADLVRHLNLPCQIDFMEASSYGDQTISQGEVRLKRDLGTTIEHRHVLLVEDIIDTGHTMDFLIQHLRLHRPQSLRVCSFLHKPSRGVKTVRIDFLGFTIEDHFVVGYGLDFDGRYRHLPDLAILTS